MPTATGHDALDRDRGAAGQPAVYAIADAVPVHDSRLGGRPDASDLHVGCVRRAGVDLRSARRVEAELQRPVVWGRIRGLVRERFPDDPERWLQEIPMRRFHCLHGRSTYLARPAVLEQLREVHRR